MAPKASASYSDCAPAMPASTAMPSSESDTRFIGGSPEDAAGAHPAGRIVCARVADGECRFGLAPADSGPRRPAVDAGDQPAAAYHPGVSRGPFLDDALAEFRKYKALAERAMAQLDDAQFFATLGPEENSVALMVKHMTGNQRSRWTDFLTSDGEKPDRHRDEEFEQRPDDSRASLMARWEDGWRR